MATSKQSISSDGQGFTQDQQSLPPGKKDQPISRVSIGIAGLDEILYGGFISKRAYLVRGGPGCGKTTLGLHFLTEGVARGERSLFITLGEPEAELRANAMALGFGLEQVRFLDLSPNAAFFTEMQSYDIFSPAEVEREPVTQQILTQIEEFRPQRVFLDAMTQFRYLATDSCASWSSKELRLSLHLKELPPSLMTICNL